MLSTQLAAHNSAGPHRRPHCCKVQLVRFHFVCVPPIVLFLRLLKVFPGRLWMAQKALILAPSEHYISTATHFFIQVIHSSITSMQSTRLLFDRLAKSRVHRHWPRQHQNCNGISYGNQSLKSLSRSPSRGGINEVSREVPENDNQ